MSFPARPVFTIQGKDTVEYPIQNAYKILTYIDSTGCTSCKLKLAEWEKFITVVDSIRPHTVQFLFFLCPKNGMEIYQTLRVERFKHPICIDEGDYLNKLNHFPADMAFQTFLLDNDNRVVAMGNPIHNLKVRELYLKIIQGREVKSDDEDNVVQTIVDVDKVSTSMGNFDWQKEQKVTFIMVLPQAIGRAMEWPVSLAGKSSRSAAGHRLRFRASSSIRAIWSSGVVQVPTG